MQHRRVLAACVCVALLAGCNSVSQTLSPSPAQFQELALTRPAYKTVYRFQGGNDGAFPEAGLAVLTHHSGVLFGTTESGGGSINGGTAFEVTIAGIESVLYRFHGSQVFASLISSRGELYGTTRLGGSGCGLGCGTIYALRPSGKVKVIYEFKGGLDGAQPVTALLNVSGEFYGTTPQGGKSCSSLCGNGTVYKVSKSGDEQVLYRFKGPPDGAYPDASLTDFGGALYGTTQRGGREDRGTVFQVSTSGTERVLYSFRDKSDGAYPVGPLVAVGGKLYGTTTIGGARGGECKGGCGTIFEIDASGSEHVIYRFLNAPDGSAPVGNLVALNGSLYGVTACGGNTDCRTQYGCHGNSGCGIVYKLSTSGRESILHTFGSPPDGSDPLAGLIAVDGTLYGTTAEGGTSDNGTVYAAEP